MSSNCLKSYDIRRNPKRKDYVAFQGIARTPKEVRREKKTDITENFKMAIIGTSLGSKPESQGTLL